MYSRPVVLGATGEIVSPTTVRLSRWDGDGALVLRGQLQANHKRAATSACPVAAAALTAAVTAVTAAAQQQARHSRSSCVHLQRLSATRGAYHNTTSVRASDVGLNFCTRWQHCVLTLRPPPTPPTPLSEGIAAVGKYWCLRDELIVW